MQKGEANGVFYGVLENKEWQRTPRVVLFSEMVDGWFPLRKENKC